jgi:hypothetical protein
MEGPWKLITADGRGTFELYHLGRDPGETNDLAADQPDRTAGMKAALEKRIRSFANSAKGADYAASSRKPN